VAPLFRFVQLELPWELGPPDGRYVIRGHAGAPRHVLVLTTLAAPERRGACGWAAGRRPRRAAPGAPPAEVPVTRATVVDAEPFPSRAAADAGGPARRRGRGGGPSGSSTASCTPSAPPPPTRTCGRCAREQALVVRVGVGEGEQVAHGLGGRRRASRAAARPAGGRGRACAPQERLAALLGGRDVALACEELTLRARIDLDAGRGREAALQLRVALEAALAELVPWGDRPEVADRLAALRAGARRVGDAANAALQGGLDDATQADVERVVGALEEALRARTAGRPVSRRARPAGARPGADVHRKLATPPRVYRLGCMALDDRSLVTRIGAGDDHAFTELAERHRAGPGAPRAGQARRGAGRRGRGRRPGALIKALRALRAGADPVAPGAWLRVIVARCAYDLHAAAGRRPTVPVDEDVAVPGGVDPEEAVQRRAEMRETVAAIVRLPEAQREALVGYELAGKTYDELGAEHGWSTPATKSLLWRARTTLAAERRKWAAARRPARRRPPRGARLARPRRRPPAHRRLGGPPLQPGGARLRGRGRAHLRRRRGADRGPARAPARRAPAGRDRRRRPRGPGGGRRRAPVRPPRAAPLLPAPRPRAPGPRASDSPADVVAACAAGTGPLTGFSLGALRRAERTLPAQVEQYTDCGDRISRALLRSA
jgi:DNA-directed RNA polymerase specialized sigma24 family protein